MAKRVKTQKSNELRAVGVTCGIGSMLVGARAAGFRVVGNVEWRKYYHVVDEHQRNTFTENFHGAIFPENLDHLTTDQIEKLMGADIALGHPECGRFSLLDGANQKVARDKGRPERAMDPADIPLFVDIIGKLRPRYFVMDDLPKSLQAFTMRQYHEGLREYDLFPEWVSNWGYGNVQRQRNRMFMLGALKTEQWTFRPGESDHQGTVRSVLEVLPTPRRGSNVPNHDPHQLYSDCFRALNLGGYRKKNSWGDVQQYFKEQRTGHTLAYEREDGSTVNRIGFVKGHWDGPAHVLTGGNACLHPLRCTPYTIRERARLQGFPDDFVFYGTVLDKDGKWSHDENHHMIRQTGKAMPVQFCEYVSRQVAAHIRGELFKSTGTRLLKPDEYVSEAKSWYCQEVGYSDQRGACGQCWLYDRCTIRTEKYKIGEFPVAVAQPLSRAKAAELTRAARSAKSDSEGGPVRSRARRATTIGNRTKKRRYGEAPLPVDVDFGD